MSVQSRKMSDIARRVREIHAREIAESRPVKRWVLGAFRWASMLEHEFVRDDVRVRAESLSFLMIFSLLPLIAGGFFLFTLFAHFGMVQDAIQGAVNQFLSTIPEMHREFVQDYILKFKDAYLASLSDRSSSIGIFALFILIWVGLKSFSNIEQLLNHVWSADRQRPFAEQLRNFLVICVLAPLVLIGGLSIPLILQKAAVTRPLFQQVPLLTALMNLVVTPALILVTFIALYGYVPVRRVYFKSALTGAAFATIFLEISNAAMQFYFKFGMQTAYGKAAIVPLVGFWIYVVWIVLILGAEVSYLMQHQNDFLIASDREPTVREGESLLTILNRLFLAHRDGKNPLGFETLRAATGLESSRMYGLMEYLNEKGLVLECKSSDQNVEEQYVLAKDISRYPISDLLRDFFESDKALNRDPLVEKWREGMRHWANYFSDATIPAFDK